MYKIVIFLFLFIVISISVYLYITRARDYRIEFKNFKNSELLELTFRDRSGNVILRDNGKPAGIIRRGGASLFKASNLSFDIGHTKLKEIIIMGKLNDVDIILYQDNIPIFEVNNITEDSTEQPIHYTF
uniref:Uncharacterized protein n=1 Tax=viral metagenome TaxID=1070528 RepID=A0A6C0HEI1_9ZZZZ